MSQTLDHAERPTRVRFVVLALLGSLAFLTYFDRICITEAAGPIQRQILSEPVQLWGWTIAPAEQMGLIMGAFWFAYAIFELPVGWMGDRFGARGTIARIVIGWSLFTALSGSATGFVSLLLYRFLFGVGEAGAFPNMARVQSRWLPVATRAQASAMLWLMARWGGAFSPLLFGLIMRAFGYPQNDSAWRAAFWVSGGIGVVWVVVFWLWFRDHPSEKASVNAAELALITKDAPPEVRGHTMDSTAWRALFTSPSLWAMGIYYLFGSFGWSFFASWMPRYFDEVLHVPLQRSNWMKVGPLFFGGLACLAGGALSHWLVTRTGRKRLFRAVFPLFGASTAAVAMFCMQFVETPMQATVLLCLASAAFDFGQASNWATIVDLGGRYAGTSAGFINLVGNMGNAFQPVIGAMIFNAVGWDRLFGVYSIAFLIAASMWFFIDPRKRFDEPRKVKEATLPMAAEGVV